MKTKFRTTLALLVSLLLFGCDNPLPPSKLDYEGRWESENMLLIITRQGQVNYKRRQGNANTSIDAPIKEFTSTGFSVGFGFFSTDFVVNQKPTEIDGQWQMTVDGVVLMQLRDDDG